MAVKCNSKGCNNWAISGSAYCSIHGGTVANNKPFDFYSRAYVPQLSFNEMGTTFDPAIAPEAAAEDSASTSANDHATGYII